MQKNIKNIKIFIFEDILKDKNFVIVSKENGYCEENSVLDEIFSVKEFNRDKISDDEIIKFMEEKIEETRNI